MKPKEVILFIIGIPGLVIWLAISIIIGIIFGIFIGLEAWNVSVDALISSTRERKADHGKTL